MRLHRLDLSAFLAFPGHETVDFDLLGEAGLFLLQGRTGAGKTSLLDAVCFAFYGDVPGARAGAARLRSDHAAPDVPTEVVLEATLRGRRVRITRAPEQERPKLRGDGTTTEAHRVRVVALDEDGSEVVLATRHDEARQELGDLLGMTREQFCQVVLLPQGGFARFLHAHSDEREAILRELFDVGRFAHVERWLKDRKHDAERAAREAMGAVRDVVNRSAQAAGAEPPEDWAHAPEAVVQWLDEQLVVTEASAATAQESCTGAAAEAEAAATALAAGRDLAGRQQEHARAAQRLAAWEAGGAARDAAAAELAGARRAAPAQAHVETLRARAAAAESAERDAAVALAAAEQAGVRVPAPTAAALHTVARELRGRAGSARALTEREAAVEAAARTVGELRERAAGHAADAERLRLAIAAAEAGRPELEATLAAARDAAARLDGLRDAHARTKARAEHGAERDRLAGEAERAGEAHLRAREAAVAAQERHADLLRRRLDGIAAELAARLADGDACAVCGSVEHPSPAAPPDGGLVDAAEVHAAEARAASLVGARDEAAATAARVEAGLAAAQAVAGEASLVSLREDERTAATALEAAGRAAGGLEAAQAALAALATEVDAAATARQEAQVVSGRAEAEARQRASALAADQAEVERARDGAATIAERAARLDAAADAADAAADALDASARCASELALARDRAVAEAAGAGFDGLEALRAALRDEAACDALETRLRAYDDGLAERRTAAARAELVAAAAEPAPDVPALEAAAAAAARAAERAQGDLVLARRRHTDLVALRAGLDDALAAAGPARERHALLREVADLANGTSASNRMRMRLSAYVLAARLEEVAAAATVRLHKMSGGRYALEHADDTARGNRRGGLDLRVVDAWTGRDRSPSSLSGGETFLASLALALGLADVVTAEAGGAGLETLFVDEGFGSLDDEGTLDEVLAVLDALRDGGRAIGIVSHVAELRQRIPVQLRVEKGRTGSHVVQAGPLTAVR
jgi:exonuclease SbcC